MKSIVISFRLSPSELAKGLDSLKLHDDTSSYRNLSSIVRSCYYHGITKLNPNPASPPSIESHNQVLALTRQGNSKQKFENILTDYDTEEATTPDIFIAIPIQDKIKCQNVHSHITSDPSLTQTKIQNNLTAEDPELVRITQLLLNHNIITQEEESP